MYVVCMDSYRLRDTQMFDTSRFSDDELLRIDPFNSEMENHWLNTEVTPYIGVVSGENSEEACRKAAKKYRYDPRVLFGIEIKIGGNLK